MRKRQVFGLLGGCSVVMFLESWTYVCRQFLAKAAKQTKDKRSGSFGRVPCSQVITIKQRTTCETSPNPQGQECLRGRLIVH